MSIFRRLHEYSGSTSGELPWLRPDAKAQVSVRYADDRPVAVGARQGSCVCRSNADRSTGVGRAA